jgi:hypothetical protein
MGWVPVESESGVIAEKVTPGMTFTYETALGQEFWTVIRATPVNEFMSIESPRNVDQRVSIRSSLAASLGKGDVVAEARIVAEEVRPGMVWWLPEQDATILIVRISKIRKRGWSTPKLEIATCIVTENKFYVDTYTYEEWELFIDGAVMLRGPR